MEALRRLWAEVMTTGDGGSGYGWAVIACGHLMLGAALAGLLVAGPAAMLIRLAVTAIYWLLKERRDLRRGGSLRDGLIDTALVGVGLFYGPWWWPVMAFAAICVGAVFKEMRRGSGAGR